MGIEKRAIFALLPIVLAACAGTPATSDWIGGMPAKDMSLREARLYVEKTLARRCFDWCKRVRSAHLTTERLDIERFDAAPVSIALENLSPRVKNHALFNHALTQLTSNEKDTAYFGDEDADDLSAKRLADALALIRASTQANGAPFDLDDDAFVRAFQGVSQRRELPEEVRKLKIHADIAIREGDFHEAALVYKEALHQAPWWADGYFNRALTLAQLRDFRSAAKDMNRYLLLQPNGPDANSARLRIEEWRSKGWELGVPR